LELPAWLRSITVSLCAFVCVLQTPGQSHVKLSAIADDAAKAPSYAGLPGTSVTGFAASVSSLPPAPEPATSGDREKWNTAPAGTAHQDPFSRIGIGANVSPLGIGINATTVLSDFFDARLMGNFFNYTSGRFEIDSFNSTANLHLASMAASLDWYPFNSVWRLSPSLMFFNDNQILLKSEITPGNSITLNRQDFHSPAPNPLTGATPLTGSAVLGLHTHQPAFTLAGGFGKFVPRSERHWSFPAEFGVVFTGAPSVDVTPSGWVCLDAAQTQCSAVSNPSSPISQQFNTALQSQLTKWRHDLARARIYPMFSYSVVYSFNIR
jgi:hypothetical protein